MTDGPPPEWERMEDEDGVPAWRHHVDPVRVATWDFELLRQLDMALVRHAEMGPSGATPVFPAPPPGPGCYWTSFKNSS
jgi:hypothetical protein